ncbi:hypothetical protein [Alkalicoccus daliensis]|uniref:DUF3221 domain-containing protein n=1 Tax=Alkalicoccus daliensis TaxID=745820 RepID=A0A1H0CZ02_9BACI|nr:hypothetical protein [Alkalicoccus daliensis]SDN63163.1 hypothetical protein SAMN04488053_102284 [Alkalicoccus daliensis]
MIRKLYVLIVVILLLAACEIQPDNNEGNAEETIGNPTAEEVLSSSPDADIFMAGDIIYSNAEDIDWVMEADLTLGEEVMEITKQSTNIQEFESGTATELPVGTKIFDHNEHRGAIYIAVVEGEEIRYIGLIEG